MVKCTVCGSEQEIGDFCTKCGSPMNLDYQNSKQIINQDILVHPTSFPKRFCLVLFQEDARLDIKQNNYNLEIILIYVLVLGLSITRLYFQFLGHHQSFVIGPILQRYLLQSFLISVVSFGLIMLLSYIIAVAFFANRNITINKIFRIYIYTYLSVYFIISIFMSSIYVLAPQLDGSLPVLLTASFVSLFLYAIGYKTLFKTHYLIAVLILLIIDLVVNYATFYVLIGLLQIGL